MSSCLRRIGSMLFWSVMCLLFIGILPALLMPRPAVGIIRVNTDIWAGSAALIQAEIEAVRQDPDIKAVVVQLDSPGGEVVASQAVYLALQNLRREMPVVGSIDSMAASGAYYAAMGTHPIYAKPSSSVGNVGVWAYAPEDLAVNDIILASGPFKLTGSHREEFLRELEGIKKEFLATVFTQRGEDANVTQPISLTAEELSKGLLYPGREALKLGLIDYIGTQSEAIEKAAEQAGIAHYNVVDLENRVLGSFLINAPFLEESWVGAADPVTGERSLPYGIYLLWLPYDIHLRSTP